jgi:uncharacterized protein YoxC
MTDTEKTGQPATQAPYYPAPASAPVAAVKETFDLGSLFDKVNAIASDVQKIRAEASNNNATLGDKIETIGGSVQDVLSKGDAIAKAAGLSDKIDALVAALEKHLGISL